MTLSSWALSLWSLAWACYLLANTARVGGEADGSCSKSHSEDYDDTLCKGYAAAATFYIFGFVVAAAAAVCVMFEQILGQRGLLFLSLSLAMFCFALTAEFGAQSQAICDENVDDDIVGTFCQGYGAAATFYCFAAVAALVLTYFTRAGVTKETLHSTSITFYAFLAVYSLAWMTQLATNAHSGCEMVESDDIVPVNMAKASVVRCNGFGFSTFTALVAMCCAIGGIVMTVRANPDEDDGQYSQHFMTWFAVFVPILFGTLVNYAANAQIDCQIFNHDDDDNQCSGNVSASVFMTLAVLIAALGIIGAHHQKLQMRNTSWLMAWALFFLAYTSYLGAESATSCENLKDTDDRQDDDVYAAACNGYSAATFFMFVGFMLTVVAVFFEFRAHPGNDFFEIHFHSAEPAGPAFTPIGDDDIPSAPYATAEPFVNREDSMDKTEDGAPRFETQDL